MRRCVIARVLIFAVLHVCLTSLTSVSKQFEAHRMHVGLSNRIPRTLPCSGGCEPAPSNDRKHDSGFLAVVHKRFEFIQNNKSLEGHVQKKGAAVLLRDGVQLTMFTAQAVPISFDANMAALLQKLSLKTMW